MSNPNGMASASAAGLHQVYGCKIAGLLETRGPKTRYIPYQKLKIGDTEKPRHARPLQIQRFRIVHGDMAQPAARKKKHNSRTLQVARCYDMLRLYAGSQRITRSSLPALARRGRWQALLPQSIGWATVTGTQPKGRLDEAGKKGG